MPLFKPLITPEVTDMAPGFRALSITVQAAAIADPTVGTRALEQASLAMAREDAPWADAHLSAGRTSLESLAPNHSALPAPPKP